MKRLVIKQIESQEELTTCAKVLVEAYNAEPWNDEWTTEKALEKLTCFYNSPKFIGYTASIDSEVVGCLVGNIEPYYTGDYFYLKEMFVTPGIQKQGVGKQLMETLKQQLSSIDIQNIILFTGKDYFPYDFYLKSGFNTMEEMRMMHFGAEK